jgi:hypothetical protein
MSTSTNPPICGAQQPGSVPSPFKWQGLAAAGTAIAILAAIIKYAPAIIHFLGLSVTVGTFVVSAAAALAILALVFYYAFQADGCIIAPTKGDPICLSGIVQDTTDESSTAVDVLAPFAIGPAGMFDLVVKTVYFGYVTQNSYFNFCNAAGAPMLPCIIKSKVACGAKIGSLVGATAGAIGGAIAGAVAGTAITAAAFCALSAIFYLLCVLIAIIVAAIVAAAIAYAGAVAGGAIGEGIADAANSDPVGSAWKALQPGAIVTVQGNWITDPDIGNNELFYTTSINRTGQFPTPPDYTTADADSTAADDCPVSLPPIQ